MFGQRLRIIRQSLGLSLRDLQAAIDNRVTAQSISKYERGESIPSPGVLKVLARALGVSPAYLTDARRMILEGVEFRGGERLLRRQAAQVQARVIRQLERYLTVEDALRLPSATWDRPWAAPYPVVRDPSEAELAARSLRVHWGLGGAPIPNMAELLEDRGIKVLALELGRVDGLTAWARRRGADRRPVHVIVVNDRKRGDRQRFTMAHELGHIALDIAPEEAESGAHHFAGAFLMPAETLRREVGRHRRSMGWSELFGLKRMFGVSAQALTHRCQTAGIFSGALCRQLFRDFSRLGWSAPPFIEPVEIPRERPGRFERLCFRALAEGAISKAEATGLLGITLNEVNRRMYDPVDDEKG